MTLLGDPKPRLEAVDVVKWIATAIQLIGYGLTGMNLVPWNVYAFFAISSLSERAARAAPLPTASARRAHR